MEEKINIAEILENKSQGTKLYSLTYGDCFYQEYTGDFGIECQSQNGVQFNLDEYGKYCIDGECIIFPSKDMREWSKFAWKRGDVLVSNDGKVKVIFDKFRSNTYLSFIGKYHIDSLECNNPYYQQEGEYATGNFKLEEVDAAQTYINTIEERLGGKLNRETLEVEKAQPEFKDADIAFADYGNRQDVFIVSDKTDLSEGYNSFISLDLSNLTLIMGYRRSFFKKDLCKLRLATEEEKLILFDTLAKNGKAWDAENKMVVDLKPKCEFKPFDKVLVRNDKEDQWSANIFSYQVRDNMYYCLGECYWRYCIPYEGNEHLLGTTKDVEG